LEKVPAARFEPIDDSHDASLKEKKREQSNPIQHHTIVTRIAHNPKPVLAEDWIKEITPRINQPIWLS